MVNRVVELSAPEAVLRLSVDERGWCELVLEEGGQRHTLGAESVTVVVERLQRGLANRLAEASAGEIDGVPVTWVLSLAERHGSIYATDAGNQRILFFQAADGSLIGRVALSDDVRRTWNDALGSLTSV